MTLQYAKTIRKKLRELAGLLHAMRNKHFFMAQYRGEDVIGKRSAVRVIPWWDL